MIQDEIREGVARIIPCDNFYNECDCCAGMPEDRGVCGVQLEISGKILSYLHSKGVVIKVDRGLPENPYVCKHEWPCSACAFAEGQAILIGAHYVEVKPLIKE